MRRVSRNQSPADLSSIRNLSASLDQIIQSQAKPKPQEIGTDKEETIYLHYFPQKKRRAATTEFIMTSKLMTIKNLPFHPLTILNLESPHGKSIFCSHKRRNKATRLTPILYYRPFIKSFQMIKHFLNEPAFLGDVLLRELYP